MVWIKILWVVKHYGRCKRTENSTEYLNQCQSTILDTKNWPYLDLISTCMAEVGIKNSGTQFGT